MAVTAASTPVTEGLGFGPLVQVAMALALVVLLILAIAWLLRRLQAGGVVGSAELRVVAALPLGPRERLLVVDAAGTQILLGVTPAQITRLHEFPEPVIAVTRPAPGEFATRLRQALGKGQGA